MQQLRVEDISNNFPVYSKGDITVCFQDDASEPFIKPQGSVSLYGYTTSLWVIHVGAFITGKVLDLELLQVIFFGRQLNFNDPHVELSGVLRTRAKELIKKHHSAVTGAANVGNKEIKGPLSFSEKKEIIKELHDGVGDFKYAGLESHAARTALSNILETAHTYADGLSEVDVQDLVLMIQAKETFTAESHPDITEMREHAEALKNLLKKTASSHRVRELQLSIDSIVKKTCEDAHLHHVTRSSNSQET